MQTKTINERARHTSPGGRPQPIAVHDGTLWVGCWDTSRLYAIDAKTWSVRDEIAAPGQPFGMASFGGALSVVISLGEDDDRYLYRFVPGKGFDLESKTACPDLTGSHLAAEGDTLYLVQATYQRLIEFGKDGSVRREIALPTRCAGLAFAKNASYMISADDEFENLRLATFDIHAEHLEVAPVAAMPDEARGLAFDGTAWWTCHREENEIVSFDIG